MSVRDTDQVSYSDVAQWAIFRVVAFVNVMVLPTFNRACYDIRHFFIHFTLSKHLFLFC